MNDNNRPIGHTEKCECLRCQIYRDQPDLIRRSFSIHHAAAVELHTVVAVEKVEGCWLVYDKVRWTYNAGPRRVDEHVWTLAEWQELVKLRTKPLDK